MGVTYKIHEARIVAAITGGGAVVESGLTLAIDEGRTETWTRAEHAEGIRELEYHLLFAPDTGNQADVFEGVEARIIIEGTHENGLRVEIRGEGLIGFNEHGEVEGWFERPPRILIDDNEDQQEVSNLDQGEMPVRVPAAKRSPQFARALHARIVSEEV